MLTTKLGRIIKDVAVYDLLVMVIDSYEKCPEKGLPMGNQISWWFALYYLDSLDCMAKGKCRMKYYTRYMDDCVMICEDKQRLFHEFVLTKEKPEGYKK